MFSGVACPLRAIASYAAAPGADAHRAAVLVVDGAVGVGAVVAGAVDGRVGGAPPARHCFFWGVVGGG